MKPLVRDAFRYTPFFCEENIWWLARGLVDDGMDPDLLSVLLFSNPGRSIVLLKQRAAHSGAPVVWDYHVVLQARLHDAYWVLDFDTRLLFPMQRDSYLEHTFPEQAELPPHLRTWVRSIPAAAYLRHFYSDRSHMLGKLPASAFPDYPIILPPPAVQAIALSDYWDMHKPLADGSRVMAIEELGRTQLPGHPVAPS